MQAACYWSFYLLVIFSYIKVIIRFKLFVSFVNAYSYACLPYLHIYHRHKAWTWCKSMWSSVRAYYFCALKVSKKNLKVVLSMFLFWEIFLVQASCFIVKLHVYSDRYDIGTNDLASMKVMRLCLCCLSYFHDIIGDKCDMM